jgi:hypothetical protein
MQLSSPQGSGVTFILCPPLREGQGWVSAPSKTLIIKRPKHDVNLPAACHK